MVKLLNNLPTDWGHWSITKDIIEQFDDNTLGFLYRITNLEDNRTYIGKKQMFAIKKLKPLKGKKNKRHKVVETDWKTYTSSSEQVNKDIIRLGKDKFLFEIIKFCSSKSQLAYYEAKMQFEEDVLLNESSYNNMINLRISKVSK